MKCRAWGIFLFVLWIGLHGVAFAEDGKIEAPKESVLSDQAPTPTATQSNEAREAGLSDRAIQVVKTDVQYAVDFPYLRAVAPNSIAWLYQPNTTINQPVMFSDNPEYYLKRQFNDRINSNGAIFMKGEEVPDFSASVITIYGVNCMDNTWFGSFSFYRDEEYYEENPMLYLITPEGNYQLDIFAGIRAKYTEGDAWQVSQKETAVLLADDLPGILEKSFIKPNPSFLPTQGDAWAVLSTEAYGQQGSRYVMYARKRPVDDFGAPIAYVNQLDMDSRETLNGYVSVATAGTWMMYAQNDPIWNKLVFEVETSSRRRPFGDGGCGPTAVAMAIANIVEIEELSKISQFASSPYGFRFCKCSVNDYWCSSRHLTYQITTPNEYLRYFPMAVASFATGNNTLGVQGRSDRFGTNMSYLEALCSVYDLSVTKTYDIGEALAFLQHENTIAVACVSGYGNPFTKTSHFLTLAGVDDDYLYALDSLRREDYQALDKNSYLEVIKPGLVRIKLENVPLCRIRPIYLIQRNAESS